MGRVVRLPKRGRSMDVSTEIQQLLQENDSLELFDANQRVCIMHMKFVSVMLLVVIGCHTCGRCLVWL